MQIPKQLILAAYRVGSLLVYGTTAEANWIYEKVQRPSSCVIVLMNFLYWKLRVPRVQGIVALIMEPVFDCNLRCKYCPRGFMPERLEGLRPRLMRYDTFRAAVDQTPRTVETIQLSGLGEPLLHPQICEMVEAIADRGIRPSLFTNGTLLRGDLLRRLARTRLSVLNVSIEPDAETCREYRGIDLDVVRSQVAEFAALKRSSTEVKVRLVAHPGNVGKLAEVRDRWHGIVDDIKICPVFSLGDEQGSFSCMEPWRGNLNIWSNGKVTPCCADGFGEMYIGDVHEQPLPRILRGQAYRNLLRLFVEGNVPPRCRRCSAPQIEGMPSLLPRKTLGKK